MFETIQLTNSIKAEKPGLAHRSSLPHRKVDQSRQGSVLHLKTWHQIIDHQTIMSLILATINMELISSQINVEKVKGFE